MTKTRYVPVLVLLGLALAGLLVLGSHGERAEAGDRAPRRHLVCQVFEVDIEAGARLETADQTQALGQWVATHEAAGWQVATTDFEVGQTATGRQRAWTQVCLEREL